MSMAHPGRMAATIKEHKAIVEAIAQGNVMEAQRAAANHMEQAEKTLLNAMDAQAKKSASENK